VLKVSKDIVRRIYQARKMALGRINLREQADNDVGFRKLILVEAFRLKRTSMEKFTSFFNAKTQ